MSFPTVACQLPSLILLLLKIFLTTLLVYTDLSLNGLILELVYYASKINVGNTSFDFDASLPRERRYLKQRIFFQLSKSKEIQ